MLTAISLSFICQRNEIIVSDMVKKIAKNKKVFGVGINDYEGSVCDENGKLTQAFRDWYNMLARCYGKNKGETYKYCRVCDEWLHSSKFIEWHNEHYIDGYELDKDIIRKGNKLYSPETCFFVPREINSMLTNRKNDRGKYPIGVRRNTGRNGYISIIWTTNGIKRKVFYTIEEAFLAYKQSKEMYIKHIADKYRGRISERAYSALCCYTVNIDD